MCARLGREASENSIDLVSAGVVGHWSHVLREVGTGFLLEPAGDVLDALCEVLVANVLSLVTHLGTDDLAGSTS